MPDGGGGGAPAGPASNVGNASPGFNNIDKLNLGNTLEVKQQGGKKKRKRSFKSAVRALIHRGFSSGRKTR